MKTATKKKETPAATQVKEKPEVAESKPAKTEPKVCQASQEDIALRAYQIWQERGCTHGSHEGHWLEAEAELTKKKK